MAKEARKRRSKTPDAEMSETEQRKALLRASPKLELVCAGCDKSFHTHSDDNFLFVEEEMNRPFCSENCVYEFFKEDVQFLEQEYLTGRQKTDLKPDQIEEYSDLKMHNLLNPDEVWVQRTLAGDKLYSFISEYKDAGLQFWVVCVTLCLQGTPSFLFLSFASKDSELVQKYRRGLKVERIPMESGRPMESEDQSQRLKDSISKAAEVAHEAHFDRLGDAWTGEEIERAQILKYRQKNDIPFEEFGFYRNCLEESLETPTEVWSLRANLESADRPVYHFIKRYEHEDTSFWFVVITRDTDQEDQLEILDAFPTRDPGLVDRFRVGRNEIRDVASAASNQAPKGSGEDPSGSHGGGASSAAGGGRILH